MSKIIIYKETITQKITFKLLLLLVLQLSLLLGTRAQAFDLEQKVSINLKDAAAELVIRELDRQVGLSFTYDRAALKNVTVPVVKFENAPLATVLEYLQRVAVLDFTVVSPQTIVVRKAKNVSPALDVKKEIRVKGTVTDSSGEPLPGVSIAVKGTSMGTVTDLDGKYTIAVGENAVLVFSMIGFTSQEIGVTGRAIINVVLQESTSRLNEVVIVGYGTSTKKDLTGAVAKIESRELEHKPVLRADQMLQGRVTGMEVKSVNGAPGAGTTIRIRGARSINATNEPLYVIDGMVGVGDLNSINPNDIASIDVLKDASATAIYGSRGANGVILITTKQGKAGQDNVSINYNVGFERLPQDRKPDLMNGPEFVQFIKDAREQLLTPAQLTNDQQYQYVSKLDLQQMGEGTDWIDEVTQTAPFHNLNVSTSGGTEKLRYYLSGNYANQDGIILGSGFERYQARLNIDKHFGDNVQMGAQINLNRSRTDNTPISFSNWWNSIMMLSPTFPVFDEEGKYYNRNYFQYSGGSYLDNPIASSDLIDDYVINKDVMANFYVDFKLAEGLRFRSNLGTKYGQDDRYYYIPTNMPTKVATKKEMGYASISENSHEYLLSSNTLTFDRTFKQHSLNTVVGATYQKDVNKWLFASGNGFVNNVYKWNNLGAAEQDQRGTGSYDRSTSIVSFLGRANYNYDGKYYLTLTGRRDGASNFAQNNKWGFFPSVAVKWRLSEENAVKQLGLFDDLAIRASYGLSGNQGIAPYSSLPKLNSTTNGYIFNDAPNTAYYAGTLANDDLTWETSKQLNIGLEMILLKGRLSLDANYYNINTTDLLLNVQIPRQTGYSSRLQNLGETYSKGFEFSISSTNIQQANFSWHTRLNISTNEQEIVDLGPLVKVATDNNGYGGVTNYYEVGVPLGALYGAEYAGTWKSQEEINQELAKPAGERAFVSGGGHYRPGHMKYVDINKDGQLNLEDMPYQGSPNPELFGSIENTVRYQNWDLTVSVNGNYGSKMYNNLMFFMGTGASAGVYTNQYSFMNDRWHSERNPGSDIPAPNSRDNVPSTYLLQDASFLRLSNVILGYTFKSERLGWLDNAYVYLSGRNLWLLTDYNNFDPEVNASGTSSVTRAKDNGVYPNSRAFTAGIEINF